MADGAASDEIAFLRAQVSALQTRLSDTLTQQVAQQQTVLIAAMQANLAMTQIIERLNRVVEELEDDGDDAEKNPSSPIDFNAVLGSLARGLSGAGSAWRPDVKPTQTHPPTATTTVKPKSKKNNKKGDPVP